MTHIQINNLHINLIESDLQRLFTPFGEIDTITIMRDKFNNRSKGTAMIEMPVEKEAIKAVDQLDGTTLNGKVIRVLISRETMNQSWF